MISMSMSRSGSSPDRSIIARASSTMRTGSPMSSTNTSAPQTSVEGAGGEGRRGEGGRGIHSLSSRASRAQISEPERMISWTASGIVMK